MLSASHGLHEMDQLENLLQVRSHLFTLCVPRVAPYLMPLPSFRALTSQVPEGLLSSRQDVPCRGAAYGPLQLPPRQARAHAVHHGSLFQGKPLGLRPLPTRI